MGLLLDYMLKKKDIEFFCIDKIKKKRKDYYNCDILNEYKVKELIKKIFHKNDIDLLINNASFNPAVEKKLKSLNSQSIILKYGKRILKLTFLELL